MKSINMWVDKYFIAELHHPSCMHTIYLFRVIQYNAIKEMCTYTITMMEYHLAAVFTGISVMFSCCSFILIYRGHVRSHSYMQTIAVLTAQYHDLNKTHALLKSMSARTDCIDASVQYDIDMDSTLRSAKGQPPAQSCLNDASIHHTNSVNALESMCTHTPCLNYSVYETDSIPDLIDTRMSTPIDECAEYDDDMSQECIDCVLCDTMRSNATHTPAVTNESQYDLTEMDSSSTHSRDMLFCQTPDLMDADTSIDTLDIDAITYKPDPNNGDMNYFLGLYRHYVWSNAPPTAHMVFSGEDVQNIRDNYVKDEFDSGSSTNDHVLPGNTSALLCSVCNDGARAITQTPHAKNAHNVQSGRKQTLGEYLGTFVK